MAPIPAKAARVTTDDTRLSWRVLEIDAAREAERIAEELRRATGALRRRGLVVAVSGGVDSGVCAALAARAVGPGRVYALILPERDSSPESASRGRELAGRLGIPFEEQDIAPTLEAMGCYRWRDAAVRRVMPAYEEGWRMKLVIRGALEGRVNRFHLVARDPAGTDHEAALGLREYLEIVAATSFKQRVRKTFEYFHADRLNYAVVGTPNRLEYDQGFFVKNGDGAADIKPIAHLYKTQVYALARHLDLSPAIRDAAPTTDTYSLAQSQDEFYFALPYAEMDLALWAFDHQVPAAELGAVIGVDEQRAEYIYADIRNKRRTTRYLHGRPVLLGDVRDPGSGGDDGHDRPDGAAAPPDGGRAGVQ
jgi:NAD+ synthase